MTEPTNSPLWGLTISWIDPSGAVEESLWLYQDEELARQHAELVKLTERVAKERGMELASISLHEVSALSELPPEIQAIRDRVTS